MVSDRCHYFAEFVGSNSENFLYRVSDAAVPSSQDWYNQKKRVDRAKEKASLLPPQKEREWPPKAASKRKVPPPLSPRAPLPSKDGRDPGGDTDGDQPAWVVVSRVVTT